MSWFFVSILICLGGRFGLVGILLIVGLGIRDWCVGGFDVLVFKFVLVYVVYFG